MTEGSAAAQARMYLDANRPKQATQLLIASLAENPDDAECLRLLAQSYLATMTGALGGSAAMPAAQHSVVLNPNDAHAWRILSLCYTRMGWHEQARDAARTARAASPNEWVSHTFVAHADASAMLITPDTHASVAEAIRLAPNQPEAHFAAGHVAQAGKKTAAAAAHYEQTLALNPDHVGARNNLALIQMRRGNTGRAAAGFASMLAQNPNSDLALRNLRATGFTALRIIYFILAACMIALNTFGRSGDASQIRVGGIIVAAIAVGCVGGYVLWVRRKAGAYFGRFIRSVPATDKLLTAWAAILGVALIAIVVAIFLPVTAASDVYFLTEYGLVAGVVMIMVISSRRRAR
jgi:tetratricopeptide (TPR) repeat protein